MFQFQILLFVIFLVFLWGVIGEHWTVFIAEYHCVKSVRIRSFSGLYFPTFGLNTDQKNFEYGHFSRSALPTVKWEKTNMTIRWLVRNVSSYLLPIAVKIMYLTPFSVPKNYLDDPLTNLTSTAWKVSKHGVISSSYFPVFRHFSRSAAVQSLRLVFFRNFLNDGFYGCEIFQLNSFFYAS